MREPVQTTLGRLAQFVNGFSFGPEHWGEDGLPIIRIEQLRSGTLNADRCKKKVDDRFHVYKGDILFSWSASLMCRIWDGEDGLLNQHVFKVIPNETTVDAKYLVHLLSKLISEMEKAAHGSTMQHIKRSDLVKWPINLPALPEQKRIAEILDEVDASISATLTEREKLGLLEQSILHKWFHEVEAAAKKFENLGSVGTWLSGGTPSKATPSYWNGNIPWVSAKDLKVREIHKAEDYLTERGASAGTTTVDPGAILFVVRGMILAHTFPVAITRVKCAFNQDLKAIVPSDEVIPEFLHYWLINSHDTVLKLVTEASHGTKKLETEVLTRLRVPTVDKLKQQQIIKIIAELNNRIESVKNEIGKLRLVKEGLLSTLIGGTDAGPQ